MLDKIMLVLTYPIGLVVVACKEIDGWMRTASK